MNVTSTSQTQYSTATNKTNNNKEDDYRGLPTIEELLDEDGNALLNELVAGMSEKDANAVKLSLGFIMGIKSNEEVNGKLVIERETGKLDSQSILSKLDMLSKEKNNIGYLSDEIKQIVNELKDFYTNNIKSNSSITDKEDSVVDNFLDDLYSSSSTATTTASSITKETIQNKVNEYAQTLMETRGDTPESKLEVSKLLNDYKKELLQDYKESLDGATNSTMTLQQEAIIKVLLDENTKEASSLEKLLATKGVEETEGVTVTTGASTTDVVAKTEATGKMAEMQEKYKDVYTPIPDTYSKEDEEIQTREVHEAYPNYIDGPDFLKIVSSFLEGTRIELGQDLTPSEVKAQKLDYEQAFQKAYDIFGGEEAFIEMQKGAHAIMKEYPVNTWGKDERVTNETELARFTNAATYEALEQGKTIEEARIYAGNLKFEFMDTSYSTINFLETLIKAGRADQSALDMFLNQSEEEKEKAYEVDFSASNNSTMDLREYGIEGRWQQYEFSENQQDMITEIEKKIGQFNFMLNNESKIKEAYMKLDGSYHDLGDNAGYKRMINETYMPRMQEGLNIFKKYTIYDS
ncbi:MAG: hypothetical protein ACI9TV_001937 [Sulfurimonas sp.]|jgi:hypothetical protein|uniref:hypothetical protein n=1 Tax=Sulfurimonas sp. TaxID=2022749 RepID=UPI0039E2D8BC